jgi:hypothetical protein
MKGLDTNAEAARRSKQKTKASWLIYLGIAALALTLSSTVQAATALAPNSGTGDSDSSGGMSVAIVGAVANQQHALKISRPHCLT